MLTLELVFPSWISRCAQLTAHMYRVYVKQKTGEMNCMDWSFCFPSYRIYFKKMNSSCWKDVWTMRLCSHKNACKREGGWGFTKFSKNMSSDQWNSVDLYMTHILEKLANDSQQSCTLHSPPPLYLPMSNSEYSWRDRDRERRE